MKGLKTLSDGIKYKTHLDASYYSSDGYADFFHAYMLSYEMLRFLSEIDIDITSVVTCEDTIFIFIVYKMDIFRIVG